uniref:Uncharacterized protein n=1 Tax=Candidatus Kentrum sp. FW TaxID=2126338 RepID=A0A450U0M5_9GAMM|nr:MAG: hypothetical protein BECKFW1821C_GA0114237_109110 [Candidatus Kentron sp. FW]
MQGVLGEFWRNDTGIEVLPLKQKSLFRHLSDLCNRFITGKETANSIGRGFDLGLDDCGYNERKASHISVKSCLVGSANSLSNTPPKTDVSA